MIIHTVLPNETIDSIANKYLVTSERIILDNGLTQRELAIGQSLVILQPTQTYIVKDGDTLENIANQFHVPVSQLLRNNIFLMERKYIYPGEIIIISYDNTLGSITTIGYCYDFIDMTIMEKTLPFLTYLALTGLDYNDQAEIIEIDDKPIINAIKRYGVIPLATINSLMKQSLEFVDSSYNIFTDDKLSDRLINNLLTLLKTKGYGGLCFVVEYLKTYNMKIFCDFIIKLYSKLHAEGLLLFITLSPEKTSLTESDFNNVKIQIEDHFDTLIIMDYNRSIDFPPGPHPITSIHSINDYLTVVNRLVSSDKLMVGCPIIGVDWVLPYNSFKPNVNILKYYTSIDLAIATNSIINLDETSQTPFFHYKSTDESVTPKDHIVWFVDTSTIDSLIDLIPKFGLNGTGLWNIMYFLSPLWSIIISQYNIVKKLPEP